MTDALQDLLAEAAALTQLGEYDRAVVLLERATHLQPQHGPWFRMGRHLAAEGMTERAVACFNRGLDLDPTTTELDRKLVKNPVNFLARRKAGRVIERNILKIQKDAHRLHTVPLVEAKTFVFWNSGFAHAPGIVRRCHAEMQRVMGDGLVALDEMTWPFYVSIPPAVLKRVPLGKAHFSDILRVALLARYGGAWVDATCLPGQDFPAFVQQVSSKGFFAYQRNEDGAISNWFLCSSGDNYIPRMLFATLCRYWSHHDKPTHYFMFHHLFEALYLVDETFAQIWDGRIRRSADPPHHLGRSMFKPYERKRFVKMFAGASVHKLTWKFRGKVPAPDLFVSHIVRGDFPISDSSALNGNKSNGKSSSFWPFWRKLR